MHRDASSTTKVCCSCKLDKPIDQFSVKVKPTGQRQSRCKACQKIASRAHYEENRDTVKERVAGNNVIRRKELRAIVDASLVGQACACGSAHDLTYVINAGYTGTRVLAAVAGAMAEGTVRESMANSTIMCRRCMRVLKSAGMQAYTRDKAAGIAWPKNPHTKADYKKRNTTVRVDRRLTGVREELSQD